MSNSSILNYVGKAVCTHRFSWIDIFTTSFRQIINVSFDGDSRKSCEHERRMLLVEKHDEKHFPGEKEIIFPFPVNGLSFVPRRVRLSLSQQLFHSIMTFLFKLHTIGWLKFFSGCCLKQWQQTVSRRLLFSTSRYKMI